MRCVTSHPRYPSPRDDLWKQLPNAQTYPIWHEIRLQHPRSAEMCETGRARGGRRRGEGGLRGQVVAEQARGGILFLQIGRRDSRSLVSLLIGQTRTRRCRCPRPSRRSLMIGPTRRRILVKNTLKSQRRNLITKNLRLNAHLKRHLRHQFHGRLQIRKILRTRSHWPNYLDQIQFFIMPRYLFLKMNYTTMGPLR